MLGLVIVWLLSACASSPEQGVVKESAPFEPPMTSTSAHFARPSYAPGGEAGVSSGHSGGF